MLNETLAMQYMLESAKLTLAFARLKFELLMIQLLEIVRSSFFIKNIKFCAES